MFTDEIKIKLEAGKWGDWLVSWRRERCIPKGGPWGWDGWHGWNVYVETTRNLNTLSDYRNRVILSAKNGWMGMPDNMHGANWEDLVLKVPVWTIVKNLETWEVVADLDKENLSLKLLSGGRWGYGNAHFVSSTRQAPRFAELWDIGEVWEYGFELKLVADIWIIWIPSAGKSTLISVLTNVKPKIGDYPFTTITPNLWVLEYKGKTLVLEDVPGLIPWASEGKGLWIDFLKHIERTGVLLHMLDLYRLDSIFEDYENIRHELEAFSPALAEKEEIIVLSKCDLLDEEMIDFIKWEFNNRYWDKRFFVISSAWNIGLEELKDYLVENYSNEEVEVEEVETKDKVVVYDLTKEGKNPRDVEVNYEGELAFRVTWDRIEQIVRMTDFENFEAVMRVYDVLEKMWVVKIVEKEMRKVCETEEVDNSHFFEGSEDVELAPRVLIWDKTIPLEKLKYNL